jgi:hypothetical protein
MVTVTIRIPSATDTDAAPAGVDIYARSWSRALGHCGPRPWRAASRIFSALMPDALVQFV